MAQPDYFTSEIARHIWRTKYRCADHERQDRTVADTWRRVARALASVEADPEYWEARFYEILEGFKFLPGGRIQAGAGTERRVTLFNCFVMGTIEDSMDGIFDGLKEGAITMQEGGGVGYDFSTLRPRGTRSRSVGTVASGPVSFMRIWDSMCATVLSTGARRGAMMGTLRCDHPDVEEFVDAKGQAGELRRFNVSVLATDDFMAAVRHDTDWPLVFPDEALEAEAGGETLLRAWPGYEGPVPCRVVRRVQARALWRRIMQATYDYAEPGVLFIDRINELNNCWYCERISATNPCGEIPLPPYGACDLGSVNLTQFVERPYTAQAQLDRAGIAATVEVATRLLDNVIDASRFPLEAQARQARGARRIGLGVTGLADACLMLGLEYGSEASLRLAAEVMATLCHTAYRTSVALAQEKGPFPHFEAEPYLQGRWVRSLPAEIRQAVADHGIRNSHLTAIAPTGTISLLANNVSSGLEPVFSPEYQRRILELDGSYGEYPVVDYAVQRWRRDHGAGLPPAYIDAQQLAPEVHLEVEAVLQPYVDNAISKTINVPRGCSFEDFENLYQLAYDKGLKGCTTFRPNPVTGEILQSGEEARLCCTPEREAD